MASWLKKMRDRASTGRQRAEGGLEGLLRDEFWSPSPRERVGVTVADNAPVAEQLERLTASISVWDRLAADPAAAALRARWESRWDEF